VNERLRDARRKLGVTSSREAARLLAERGQQSPNFLGDKNLGVAVAPPFTHTPQQEQSPGRSSSPWLAEGMLVLSLTIATFLLLSAINTTGEAQVPSAPALAPETMDMMPFADANRDGRVTAEEYSAFSQQGWMFVSQGKDAVKVAELDEMGQIAVLGIAPDAEGMITRQMYLDAVPIRFRMFDRDGDNVLSADELNGRSDGI
jgi:hypothetical protein